MTRAVSELVKPWTPAAIRERVEELGPWFHDWAESRLRLIAELRDADAAILGSYFPHGQEAARLLADVFAGPRLFYDIDTPVTVRAFETEGAAEYLRADQVSLFDAYLSFTGGPLLDELERLLLATARLRPDRSFLVAGSRYPPDLDWPPNARRLEHVAPPDHPELAAIGRAVRERVLAEHSHEVRAAELEAEISGAGRARDRGPGPGAGAAMAGRRPLDSARTQL